MIKPVTFQGVENFKANLYALEVRSRFIDQNAANGYYAGYGNELAATVSSNVISIGTGAFLVQGRLIEIETAESLSVVIQNGKYGLVIAKIETYPASNTANCSLIIRTGNSISTLLSGLTQENTYQYAAETTNKVYELPLYYFYMSNGAITITEKVISQIKEISEIKQKADTAVSTANSAVSTANGASADAAAAVLTANAAANKILPDNSGVLLYENEKIIRTKTPFYVSTIGTYSEYTILSGNNFPTEGALYEVVYEDNGVLKSFVFNFPTYNNYSTVYLYFSLLYNVTKSDYDTKNYTEGTITYKSICWKIDFSARTVKHSKYSSGQCAATSPYFKGMYLIKDKAGA